MIQTAIVTGASQGIGAAIARRFAAEKFRLAICSRKEDDLLRIKEDLLTFGSPEVFTFPVDLSDSQAARTFASEALEALGHIDVLVNNAGTFIPGNLCEEPEGQLEYMMQLNLYAPYHISRLVCTHMKERRSGHVFNICSVASLKAYPQGGAYSISKYALLGFSDNLREELKTFGVRVTAICPGATDSRSWQGSGVPAERIMPAEDIAECLWTAYRLSDRSDVEMLVVRPLLGDL